MGDYFEFYMEPTNHDIIHTRAIRFRVISRLSGRVFEPFHIDIGMGDPIVDAVEYLTPPDYLAFADIPTSPIPCYPITQHIAEKLHAIVCPRRVESSRVKDFVDILLFACLNKDLEAERLRAAIQAIFDIRGDSIPAQLDQIPSSWQPKFNQFIKKLDLPFSQFDEAVQAAQSFFNPVLDGTGSGAWDKVSWKWVSR